MTVTADTTGLNRVRNFSHALQGKISYTLKSSKTGKNEKKKLKRRGRKKQEMKQNESKKEITKEMVRKGNLKKEWKKTSAERRKR
jgi:hypothetical protein